MGLHYGIDELIVKMWIAMLKSDCFEQTFEDYQYNQAYSPIGLLGLMLDTEHYACLEILVNDFFKELNTEPIEVLYDDKEFDSYLRAKNFGELIDLLGEVHGFSLPEVGIQIEKCLEASKTSF